MSITTTQHISVRSASEYVAHVPTLVSFQPAESLVVVLLQCNHIVVTIQMNIPAIWNDVAEQIVSTAHQLEADGARSIERDGLFLAD